MKLNEQEIEALSLVAQQIRDCTGGEFGYIDEIRTEVFTKHQLAGYASQLSQKGLIIAEGTRGGGFGQVQLTPKGLKALNDEGLFVGENLFVTVEW